MWKDPSIPLAERRQLHFYHFGHRLLSSVIYLLVAHGENEMWYSQVTIAYDPKQARRIPNSTLVFAFSSDVKNVEEVHRYLIEPPGSYYPFKAGTYMLQHRLT